MMNGWGNGGWGTGEWMLLLLGLVIVVAVIVGIAYLVRGRSGGAASVGGQAAPGHHDSPEDVLKRRYAAGEIEREDYETRLRDLRS